MLFTSVAAVIGAVALANAQANEPGPRGVVIEGDYSGALRPQIHYSPPKGFMNDPNGMFIDSEGVWHLYYQCEWSQTMTAWPVCAARAIVRMRGG